MMRRSPYVAHPLSRLGLWMCMGAILSGRAHAADTAPMTDGGLMLAFAAVVAALCCGAVLAVIVAGWLKRRRP